MVTFLLESKNQTSNTNDQKARRSRHDLLEAGVVIGGVETGLRGLAFEAAANDAARAPVT
jgi:hypothetical protein